MLQQTIDQSGEYATIKVARLKELLAQVPDDWEVWPMDDRHLSIGDGMIWRGHIDIETELYVRDSCTSK